MLVCRRPALLLLHTESIYFHWHFYSFIFELFGVFWWDCGCPFHINRAQQLADCAIIIQQNGLVRCHLMSLIIAHHLCDWIYIHPSLTTNIIEFILSSCKQIVRVVSVGRCWGNWIQSFWHISFLSSLRRRLLKDQVQDFESWRLKFFGQWPKVSCVIHFFFFLKSFISSTHHRIGIWIFELSGS